MIRAALVGLMTILWAAEADATPVVYECKISRSTSGAKETLYGDANGKPNPLERFALDVPAGKGCLVADDTCDARTGRLDVFQDETSIVAHAASAPLMLTYMVNRQQFILIQGNNTLTSEADGCRTIPLEIIIHN
jgi:hypothetical protein